MKWWYENEEEKMEFDRSRVYSAVNADELEAGDKVIVADSLGLLRQEVERGKYIEPLRKVLDESHLQRFKTPSGADWGLAYLVERYENCTKCEELDKEGGCRGFGELDKILCCDCYTPKTEQKAYEYDVPIKGQINEDGVIVERQVGKCHVKVKPFTEEAKKACVGAMTNACPEKHYRPFKDTDELVEKWWKLNGWSKEEAMYKNKLKMPLIWVRRKEANTKGQLITEFGDGWGVGVGRGEAYNMTDLWMHFTFLDGSPCGVEE